MGLAAVVTLAVVAVCRPRALARLGQVPLRRGWLLPVARPTGPRRGPGALGCRVPSGPSCTWSVARWPPASSASTCACRGCRSSPWHRRQRGDDRGERRRAAGVGVRPACGRLEHRHRGVRELRPPWRPRTAVPPLGGTRLGPGGGVQVASPSASRRSTSRRRLGLATGALPQPHHDRVPAAGVLGPAVRLGLVGPPEGSGRSPPGVAGFPARQR